MTCIRVVLEKTHPAHPYLHCSFPNFHSGLAGWYPFNCCNFGYHPCFLQQNHCTSSPFFGHFGCHPCFLILLTSITCSVRSLSLLKCLLHSYPSSIPHNSNPSTMCSSVPTHSVFLGYKLISSSSWESTPTLWTFLSMSLYFNNSVNTHAPRHWPWPKSWPYSTIVHQCHQSRCKLNKNWVKYLLNQV